MSYMIEGKGSKTLSKAKKWLYTHPEASMKLLQLLTDVNVDYLVGQVKAGAQMLQVFESHAEHLDEELFNKFCLPVLTQICSRVKKALRDDDIEPVPMVSAFSVGDNTHTFTIMVVKATTAYLIAQSLVFCTFTIFRVL